jgi:hypothetical protein
MARCRLLHPARGALLVSTLLVALARAQCPAVDAVASTPIRDVLANICRHERCDASNAPAGCVDCSALPSMLSTFIEVKRDEGEDVHTLVGAHATLLFLCDPCVAPIFASIVSMDEGAGAVPLNEAAAFASACGSAQCTSRYHALANTFAEASRGVTVRAYDSIKAACTGRHPDHAAAAAGVRALLEGIDAHRTAAGATAFLRAEAAAGAAEGGAGWRARPIDARALLSLAAATAALAAAVAARARRHGRLERLAADGDRADPQPRWPSRLL